MILCSLKPLVTIDFCSFKNLLNEVNANVFTMMRIGNKQEYFIFAHIRMLLARKWAIPTQLVEAPC